MTYSAPMTDSDEAPPGCSRWMVGYTALAYAITALLLLGACCYGIYQIYQGVRSAFAVPD